MVARYNETSSRREDDEENKSIKYNNDKAYIKCI